jgi:hypothetical protein
MPAIILARRVAHNWGRVYARAVATDALDAARAIRSYLPELLGESDAAASTDARLAALLHASQDGKPVTDAVAGVLAERSVTRNWAAHFLERGCPPDVVATERSVPGGPPVTVLPAPRFVCPSGDFAWWQRAAGVEPPNCPSHDQPLIRG